MSFGLSKRIGLLSAAALSIALTQQVMSLTRLRSDDLRGAPLVLLSPLRITETDSGSQITIAADEPPGEISTRTIGSWFELRIRNANVSRLQAKFPGSGFQRGHVLQSGSDAIVLIRLEPGFTALVVRGTNSLELVVSLAASPDSNPRDDSETGPRTGAPQHSPKKLLLALRSGARTAATGSPSGNNSAATLTNPPLPAPSNLNPILALVVPMPSLPDLSMVRLTRVEVSDEPPPPPVVRNPRLPSPPRLKLAATAISVAPTSGVSSEASSSSAPLLVVDDSEPPPLASMAKTSPANTPTDSALIPTNAATPTELRAPEAASAPEADETKSVAETEHTMPVDPTKPAPAEINLPRAPVPWPRGRAPLSQERRIELSGVISIDYSKTSQSTTPETSGSGSPIKNRGRNFGVGLDLHLGTFLIDPRFLKLSFDSGFTTNRGAFDEFSMRQGNKGAGVYVDFLPTSPYPFRFHLTRQNTHFLETQISSASTGRRSLGFDWALHKPHWPNLSVNFEDTSYASRFVASSSFKSQSKTLSLSLTDKVKGWDINSNFSRQSATEGITNLKTDLNFLRFDARRQLSSKANLFVNSFFEKLHFDNPRTRLGQDFSFFDIHTDLGVQQSKKLSFRASHQFYYSSNDQVATASNGTGTTGEATSAGPALPKSVTSFNAAQGQVSYRLWPALLVSGTASARFISTPERQAESASRFLDFTASISWNKRLGFAETRASFVEGVTHVRSSFGEGRGVQFRSYSAGISMGNVKRALVTADFNSTSRPDAFQIGGFFSQEYFNVAVETQALRRFQIRASVGENVLDYLTASGREHAKTTTYSLSIDDKWFTVLLNHNSNSGVRDLFLVPITLNNTRIFRVLPVDSLLRDPLLNGSGVFTLGLVRFKPRNGFDVEVRYLRDKVLFARSNNVFTQQFDILARYKLGKITLASGLIFFHQDTENLFRRDRNYFFFRLSRPFTLF